MKTNIIYNADCLEIMKTMPDNSVDLILTDPPYLYLDHKLDRQFNEQLFFTECFRVLKKDSMLCYFGRGASFYKWGYICSQLGFEFLEEVIWDKNTISNPFLTLKRTHETVSIWRKGDKQLNNVLIDKVDYLISKNDLTVLMDNVRRIIADLKNIKSGADFECWYNEKIQRKVKHCIVGDKSFTTAPYAHVLKTYQNGMPLKSVINISTEHFTTEHPTQKPAALIELLCKLCSNENDIVFDPFLGSGTTAISCLNLNRQYIGCEIDKEYFDIATKRIETVKKINKSKLF